MNASRAPRAWLSLADGLQRPGLRLALARAGVPSPWSELCRAVFHVKGLDYEQLDARDPMHSLEPLRSVTSQTSVPVAFWQNERPRANWLEILHLAERLSTRPRLLPEDCRARARIIGLCAELCSEDGFGWHRRILMTQSLLRLPHFGERERRIGSYLAGKYGYDAERVAQSRHRCEEIVATFAQLTVEGGMADSTYFDSQGLSALDLAWAAFAALIRPLPHEQCPARDLWRQLYTWEPEQTSPVLWNALLERRDRIYAQHLELPVVVS